MNEKRPKPTIRDIAREANLSPSAVSQILTGKRKGREGNMARIEAAIAKLGYQQNIHARTLATGRSGTLGLAFFFDVVDLFNAQLLGWVESLGRQSGHDVIPMNFLPARYPDHLERADALRNAQELFFQPLIQRRVEGVITQGYILNPPIIAQLREHGIAVSVWEPEELPPPDVAVTRVDWQGIMAEAVGHLHELGHRELTFVTGLRDFATVREQIEAFERAAAALGIDPAGSVVTSTTLHSEEWGRAFVLGRLARRGELPCTALLCADDRIAMGALSACHELGIAVPARLSVMGINDVHYARYTSPPLTTVAVDVEGAASMLMDGLLRAMAGERVVPQHCGHSLSRRASTGPPPPGRGGAGPPRKRARQPRA